MNTVEMKNEIQRIIDDNNEKKKLLSLFVEICYDVTDDAKSLMLLNECINKTHSANEEFKTLIDQYNLCIDSPIETQYEFWKKVEKTWDEIDNWRIEQSKKYL